MNSKQRKQARKQKHLLDLGRDAEMIARVADMRETQFIKTLAERDQQLAETLAHCDALTIKANAWWNELEVAKTELSCAREALKEEGVKVSSWAAKASELLHLETMELDSRKLRRRKQELQDENAALKAEIEKLRAAIPRPAQDLADKLNAAMVRR